MPSIRTDSPHRQPLTHSPRFASHARAILAALLLIPVALALVGCSPAVVVVGAASYGAAVVHDRRSAQTVLDDEAIELQAKHLYLQNRAVADYSRIRIISFNYTVLLAGQAESADISQRFAEQVANIAKVERVYNEVEIGPNIGLSQQGQDAMIATRGNVALANLGIPGFDPTRVKVIAENGTVFLMGLVTPEEADASADKIRRLPGVSRVVKMFDYLSPGAMSAGAPRASSATPTSAAADNWSAPAATTPPDGWAEPAASPGSDTWTDPAATAEPDTWIEPEPGPDTWTEPEPWDEAPPGV